MEAPQISVVIPLFNEEESLNELIPWIEAVMHQNRFSYEVLFIDDGSRDNSWHLVQQHTQRNPAIKGIRFQTNYGKSAALNEGFAACSGQVIITMDADLQDSPEEIPELYRMITEEGYDLISGWKKKRYDPLSKTLPTKLFNAVTRKMSGIHLHDFNCGLKAYKQSVVKVVEVYGEMHRYIPVIAKWKGFDRIGEKVVQHQPRQYGSTKFGMERFINGFLDLLSITFVSRFKKKPMHFFGTFGSLSFLVGFLITIWLIASKLVKIHLLNQTPRDVVDQPLFFLALVAIIGGLQLFTAGFLGEMVHINNRNPNEYTIAERIGLQQQTPEENIDQ